MFVDNSKKSLESLIHHESNQKFNRLKSKTHILSDPSIDLKKMVGVSPSRSSIVPSNLLSSQSKKGRATSRNNDYSDYSPVNKSPSILILPDIDAKKTRLQKLANLSKKGILQSNTPQHNSDAGFLFNPRNIIKGSFDTQVKNPVFDVAMKMSNQ